MNRQRFLAELSQLLSFMTERDRSAALQKYSQRFDEAGLEGEADLISQLGTPTSIAIKMAREYIPSPSGPAPEAEAAEPETAPGESAHSRQSEGAQDVSGEEDGAPPAQEREPEGENAGADGEEPVAQPTQSAEKSVPEAEAAAPELSEAVGGAEPAGNDGKSGPEAEETDGEAGNAAAEEKEEKEEDGEPSIIETIGRPLISEPQWGIRSEISSLFGPDNAPVDTRAVPDKEKGPPARGALIALTVAGGLLLLCLLLALACASLLPGAAGVAFALLSGLGGLWAAPVFADALFLYGIALMALGLGLLLLFLAVWLIVAIVKPLVRGIAELYRLTGGERG